MSQALRSDITTEELMSIDYRYNYSEKELIDDWKRLRNVSEYKKGSQFKPGLKLCQHFFPNFWTIENSKGMSFEKAWNDPVIMDKVRVWGLNGMSKLWLSWVRRAVYMASGLPNSSLYRPHFSKQITEMSGKDNGVLFDPCAGWGGRLLGTVANNWYYIGCEPNVETYKHIMEMIEFLEISDKVELHNIPAEEFDLSSYKKSFDVVLTSPPYFNLEVYNGDDNQSYNRHDTYETWMKDWLQPLIESSLMSLKSDGISAWNVMDMGKLHLVSDVIKIHESNEYQLFDTVGFQSPLANIRKLKNKDVTYLFRR